MIFNRMAQYGPRQDFGARYQQVFDREAMADMGGGMGRMRNPNGGINPNGMYTGGNQRPQVGLPPMAGPGQVFQAPQFQTGDNAPPMAPSQFNTGGPGQQFRAPSFITGGNTPPAQAFGLQTGGQLPPMQQSPWMTGGNQRPQSSLSRWFNTFRQGAYR